MRIVAGLIGGPAAVSSLTPVLGSGGAAGGPLALPTTEAQGWASTWQEKSFCSLENPASSELKAPALRPKGGADPCCGRVGRGTACNYKTRWGG